MLPSPLDSLLALLLTLLLLGLLVSLVRFDHRPAPPKHAHRRPRPLRPRTPDREACPHCRDAKVAHRQRLSDQWCRNRLMRALHLTHLQLDELRIKVWGQAEAAWLWVACDARTKLIPVFTLGPRTQALAHQLVRELAQRLAPGCVPVFSSDGLSLYFPQGPDGAYWSLGSESR